MKSIFIISGKKGSGKTTFLHDVLALLQANNIVVGGFVSFHELQSDCYQIKNIKTNEEFPLMQRVANFDQRPKHFKLFPEGVALGNNCIKDLLAQVPDIAIVDEIGGYELSGELWSNGFTELVKSSIPLMFTTKEKHLEVIIEKWSIKPTLIFQASDFDNPQKAVEQIRRFL